MVHVRRAFSAGILLFLVAVVTVGAPSPAAAHAVLLSATPADGDTLTRAPEKIELQFNEPVRLVPGGSVLIAPGGVSHELSGRAQDGAVTYEVAATDEGTYVFSYRIVSADGHPVSGAITFHIGAPSPGESSPGTSSQSPGAGVDPGAQQSEYALYVLTGTHYLSLVVFAGVILAAGAVIPAPQRGRLTRVVRAGYWLAAILAAAIIPVRALRALGAPLIEVVSEPWWNLVTWQDLAAAAITIGAGGAAVYFWARAGDTLGAPAIVTAGAALLAPLFVGHTQTAEPRAGMILAGAAHLALGAIWLGGLVAVALTWRGQGSIPVLRRFSRLAAWSVATLAISGGAMAVMVMPRISQVLTTGYGRVLLTKILLIAAVLVLAWRNRRSLQPAHVAGGEQTGVRRRMANEVVMIAGVLALTGVLSNLSPAGHAPAAVTVATSAQGLSVTGDLAPARVGANTLEVDLTHGGQELDLPAVAITARMGDLGPIAAELLPTGVPGRYRAEIFLPAAGQWHLRVSARVDTFTQATAAVTVEIRELP